MHLMEEQQRAARIELAVNGDPDALQQLIVDYHSVLRAAVAAKMDAATRRRMDPDDVLQNAYADAFKAITTSRFDSASDFYRWLETNALNELKNRRQALKALKRDVRREVSGPAQAATSYPDLVDRLIAPDSTPSRQVARGEAVAAVLSSLARLSDDQRKVIRLRFLEGRPVAEVADRLGKSEGAVHGLCRRGLRALRESMVSISRYLTR
jgi:RNA polymerase sigma-70 factor (ECF subfamily)